MTDEVLGCIKALKRAFRFPIIAIYGNQNVRRAAIFRNLNRGNCSQANARIGQFAFEDGLDLFAQSFTQALTMMFQTAAFQRAPRKGKTA